LQDIVHELKSRGVHLKATGQPVDTSTAAGKAFLDMLGVFAEFETNIRRERQAGGIARAKAEGVYKGGKKQIDRERFAELQASGATPTQIAKELGISRMSVYPLQGEPSSGKWLKAGSKVMRRDANLLRA
jgi:DNA invertase Pin-like site-specific DNA recombinase